MFCSAYGPGNAGGLRLSLVIDILVQGLSGAHEQNRTAGLALTKGMLCLTELRGRVPILYIPDIFPSALPLRCETPVTIRAPDLTFLYLLVYFLPASA